MNQPGVGWLVGWLVFYGMSIFVELFHAEFNLSIMTYIDMKYKNVSFHSF